MSSTQIYRVDENGEIHWHQDFRNAARGALLVWKQMGERYLGMDVYRLSAYGKSLQPVWDLWKNKTIPESHRIVMASTFDNVMVKKKNFDRLIVAVREYADTFNPGHLLEQALAIEKMVTDTIAICWNQTSVNDNPWKMYLECPCCGQTNYDDPQPYNINIGDKHWFLFERLS